MDIQEPLAVGVAPAKLILLGEHAAVYGRTAIAVPVWALEARATVWPAGSGPAIEARFPTGCGRPPVHVDVASASESDALAAAVVAAIGRARDQAGPPLPRSPCWRIVLESTIPVGVGLGSSAAVAVALIRAVGQAFSSPFDDQVVADLALEAERRTHGTPSGIDNTVIAMGRPVAFRSGRVTSLLVGRDVDLVVADSGEMGLTGEQVASVRSRRQLRPELHDAWFDDIGRLAELGRDCLVTGDLVALGRALDSNHRLLQLLGVSTATVDRLVETARRDGALGSKLSGAGGGGVILALVDADRAEQVAAGLRDAGATSVLRTTVPATPP